MQIQHVHLEDMSMRECKALGSKKGEVLVFGLCYVGEGLSKDFAAYDRN
jgi:hypothetical protein